MLNRYNLEVKQSDYIWDEDDPRTWDNLGIMLCFHKRYSLGDDKKVLEKILPDHFLDSENFFSWGEVAAELHKEFEIPVMFQLRLYDHSGITISTSHSYPYNCPWDSGYVGMIFTTKERIFSWFTDWKILNKKRLQVVKDHLLREVKIYDDYIRGDIWGFIIKDQDDEVLESLFGYYGYPDGYNQAEEEGHFYLRSYYKNDLEKLLTEKDIQHFEYNTLNQLVNAIVETPKALDIVEKYIIENRLDYKGEN